MDLNTLLPGSVNASSITTKGSWDNCTLNWEPLENMPLGGLQYEVVISSGDSFRKSFITKSTSPNIGGQLSPYSPIKVSIKAITHWGVGQRVTKMLHTPPSLPGAPHNLRTYVSKLQVGF